LAYSVIYGRFLWTAAAHCSLCASKKIRPAGAPIQAQTSVAREKILRWFR